jgi:hypothetical protein
MKSFLESFYNTKELTANTKFKDIEGVEYLKVFRSSARGDKRDYVSGSHCGTRQQALIRADYMINDEGKYDTYYLYELIIRTGDVYPKLLPDDGSDHGYGYVKDLGDYDVAFYKNTGEGDIRNENLSVIIINPDVVVQSKMIQTLDGEYLSSIQNELYR